MFFFMNYVLCFCRKVLVIIRFIKIIFKINIDFFYYCFYKFVLDLDFDVKEFNIFFFFVLEREDGYIKNK